MLQRSLGSRLLAIGLSAMMALPSPFAKAQGSKATETGSTTEGVPVVLQKTVSPSGEEGYLYLMPVPQEQELEAVRALAAKSPETTIIAVQGVDDPVAKVLQQTPGGSKVSLIAIRDAASMSLLTAKGITRDLKHRLTKKIETVTEFCRKSQTQEGVLLGFITASIMGGFAYYASSSVEAGLTAFSTTFLWNTFLMTRPQDWGRALESVGNRTSRVIASVVALFGKKLTDKGEHFAEVGGQFTLSWAVNTGLAAVVLWASDQLFSVWQAGFFGLLLNYNVWDTPFQRKVRDGVFGPEFMHRYFKVQAIVGAIIEMFSYMNVSAFQLFLFAASTFGLIYATYTDRIDNLIGPKFHATRIWVDTKAPKENVPRWLRIPKAMAVSCGEILKSGKDKIFPKRTPRLILYPPDDIQ